MQEPVPLQAPAHLQERVKWKVTGWRTGPARDTITLKRTL